MNPEEIHDAVLSYVSEHPDALPDHEVDRLEGATPRRDSDGNVRIGAWLLESRGDDPVLTRRSRGEGSTFRVTVVHLEETDDGCRVRDISEEEHRRR